MKAITYIRRELEQIPGTLADLPPGVGFRGLEDGVKMKTLYDRRDDCEGYDSPVLSVECDQNDQGIDGHFPDFDPVIEIGCDIDETFPVMGGEEGDKIRQSILLHGMDALGWYSSFHVTGIQWGIYIPVSGIGYLIRECFANLPVSMETKANLAFHAILNHELFHFAADYAIAQAEVLHQEPWWMPAKVAFSASTPSFCVIEEKLANAYMLQAFRTMKPALRVRGKQESLRAFTQIQPAGYRDGWRVNTEGWTPNLVKLAGAYGLHSAKGGAHKGLWGGFSGYDWPAQFPIRPCIDWRYCPIHIVQDGRRLGIPDTYLNFFSHLGVIEETEDFLRKLAQLATPIQNAWSRTKTKLHESITRGADFKKWPKCGENVWSVRVNDGYRAHLERDSNGVWRALAIGNHKEMGH
jgi:hypothetical protein